jgi:hypothetical protein
MTIACILYLAGFIGILVSAAGKVPLWVPTLLLSIGLLLGCLAR